jgi:OOP family OmpA-OmpF porin
MLFNGYKEVTVILSAHTDSDASDEYNQALSQRREDAVKAYLVAAGVTQEMITSGHAGETTPKADNSSEAGKAQNRRVEIKLDSADPVSPFCQH